MAKEKCTRLSLKPTVVSEQKKIKVYPTFRLGTDDLLTSKEMEVGKSKHS